MRIIIIGNGNLNNSNVLREYLLPNDIIICCDGGIKYAFEEGLTPHYIIGDLDSANEQILQFFERRNVQFKEFPREKDETDMELCIDFAIGLGTNQILIFGATGTRLDHTLANINLLLKAYLAGVNATIIDNNNKINLIGNISEYTIKSDDKRFISLIPLSSEVFVEYTHGLKYNLKNKKLIIGSSLGVSNEILEENFRIKIQNGYLLLIKSND